MPSIYESLEHWKNREQNIVRLFSADVLQSKAFLQAKLREYRRLEDQHSGAALTSELGLRVLHSEIRSMERMLYPNPVERWVRQLSVGISRYFGEEKLKRFEQSQQARKQQKAGIEKALSQTQVMRQPKPTKRLNKSSSKQGLPTSNQHSPGPRPPLPNQLRKGAIDPMIPKPGSQLIIQNTSTMNDKNYDYLSNQLKYTGFGEDLQGALKTKLQQGEAEFMLTHQKSFGTDQTVATLHFSRSAQSDLYFFNRYNLHLQNGQHPEPLKQTFYIHQNRDNISLKEGYNLLSGRSVHKDLTTKEGQTYKAWIQLDFKQTDKQGNFKLHAYNEKYGFDLHQSLQRHAIKELTDQGAAQRLSESLERGNRHQVTIVINNQERPMAIEAAPRFKSLNLYEMNGVRVRADKLYESRDQGQSVNKTQDKTIKQGASDTGEPTQQPTQKNRKRKQSI